MYAPHTGKSHDWVVLADIDVTIMNDSSENKSAQDTKLVQIGVAAKSAGISTQSLQYYLMIGLLEPVKLTPSGRRLFDEESIKTIKLIKKLSGSGYPLRAIRELFLEGRNLSKGKKRE